MNAATHTKPDIKSVLRDLMLGVSAPDTDLRITDTLAGDMLTISVFPDQRNYGRIVGGEARNVWALQLIAKLIGAREDQEVFLSVIPPKDRTAPPHVKFTPNPQWGKKQLQPLLSELCTLLFESGGVIEIVEPDPVSMIAILKVNAEDEKYLEVVEAGTRMQTTIVKSLETGHEVEAQLTFALVEQKLRTIFSAIGKNNGRNITLRITPINYPKAR